jgi:hypothetical protein
LSTGKEGLMALKYKNQLRIYAKTQAPGLSRMAEISATGIIEIQNLMANIISE